MLWDLVDEVLAEPLGGAHRDPAVISSTLRQGIIRHLGELTSLPRRTAARAAPGAISGFGVYSESPL
jgi:acetyl-CoA carboxylase carboxyl transferase subunit alpha